MVTTTTKTVLSINIYLYEFSFSLVDIYLGHSLETMPVNCSQEPAQDRDDLGEAQSLFLFLSASRVLYTSSMVFKNQILRGTPATAKLNSFCSRRGVGDVTTAIDGENSSSMLYLEAQNKIKGCTDNMTLTVATEQKYGLLW